MKSLKLALCGLLAASVAHAQSSNVLIPLLTNASSSGSLTIGVYGGNYQINLAGTLGGSTVTLTESDSAGVQQTVATFTAVGNQCIAIGAKQSIQAIVTGGAPSGLYMTAQGVQSCPTTSVTITPSGTQDVNVKQIAGTATAVGNGTTNTGTQRVTLSSDSTGQVTLASGATVAVTQPTASNLNAQVQGAGASGSAVTGNPVLIGGSDGANTRSVTTDTSGHIINQAIVFSTASSSFVSQQSDSGKVYVVNSPSNQSAAANTPVVSTSLESCHVLKASPGNLYTLSITIQATSGIEQVFDATSAPSDGSVTPKWFIPVVSNGTFGGDSREWSVPMRFSTGITVCFSSATTPFTKTASSTAAFSANVQ